MSAAELGRPTIVRNHEGVLLRYPDPSILRSFHLDQRPRISDLVRIALVRAERELRILEIIVDHLHVSDIGIDRIQDALRCIRAALDAERLALAVASPQASDTAGGL